MSYDLSFAFLTVSNDVIGLPVYRFGIQKTIADQIVLGGDSFAIGGPVNLIFGLGEAYVKLIQSLVKFYIL